jgi:hypothetical protein
VSSSPFILPTAIGLRAAGYDNESRGFNEFSGVDSVNSYDESTEKTSTQRRKDPEAQRLSMPGDTILMKRTLGLRLSSVIRILLCTSASLR